MTATTATTATEDLIGLFPKGTHLAADGEIVVGGCRLDDLAERFGTPAVIVDEGALRARAREYVDALHRHWPNGQVVFASKSFPCTAVVRVMVEEGLGVDVAGGGELVAALAAGADPARLVVHGNAKTDEELGMAVGAGAGTIVVDNFDDIDRLEKIVTDEQRVLIRVIPDVEADTHEAMATGHAGSKFGLSVPDAVRAAARLRASDRLRLDGVHVHVGSQLLDTAPFARAVEAIASLGELGEHAVYDLGGGLGVRYTFADHAPTVDEYVRTLTDAARAHLPENARLIIEPGRSLVAESALTLYRAVTVKRGGRPRALVAVDGGMGDNLEPMLYGQRFEATVTSRVGGGEPCDLVGRHCESGDTLIRDIPLRAPAVGDLIAVPVTGAYCYSISNNYNGARRPPVVFCHDGAARAVVRRETYEDLLRRDQ